MSKILTYTRSMAERKDDLDRVGVVSLLFTPVSFFSQKARLFLEEKGVHYKEWQIALHTYETYEPWYMRINPEGKVPVLKHGEKYIPDSLAIAKYVEENFAGPLLIPSPDTDQGKKCEALCQLLRSIRIEMITFGHINRPELCKNPQFPSYLKVTMKRNVKWDQDVVYKRFTKLAEKHPDLREVYLAKRENALKFVSSTFSDSEILPELEKTRTALNACEEQLHGNAADGKADHWLIGEDFTMADIELALVLNRLDFVGASHSTWRDENHKYLEKYFSRLLKRKSFQKVCLEPNKPWAMFRYCMYLQYRRFRKPVGILTGLSLLGVAGYYAYKNYSQ